MGTEDFWYALGQLGQGDYMVGLVIATKEMTAVVHRRFPNSYFDWSEVVDKAIEAAASSFDFTKGRVGTYLCKCAKTVAWDIIRSGKHPSKHELQFTDMETEDGPEVEDLFGEEDEYPTSDKIHKIVAMLDYRTFTSPSVKGHTYGELAGLLALGKDHRTIANEWGISEPTFRICLREVQQCILNLGVLSECSTGIQLAG